MARGYILRYSFTDGSAPGERHFAALPIRIGRNPLNDCPFPQQFVSHFHARLEEIEGRICVRDLGSKNGVLVRKGERIPPQTPVDLGYCAYEFWIGPFMHVKLDFVELAASPAQRMDKPSGTVLGNRKMLELELLGTPQAAAQWPQGTPLPPAPPTPPPPVAAGLLPPLPVGRYPSGGAGGMMPPVGPGPSPQRASPFGPVGPSPRPPSAPDDGRATQHFSMPAEVLAILGLRELASSLVPGQPLETTGDIARLITKLHDTVEVFCRCFVPLREGHAQFVSSMDLQQAASQRTLSRSNAYRRVEYAKDPAEVASALLDWRDPSFDAPSAIEGIFADLMLHQVALLDGVMQGVRALLADLSPEAIEKAVAERRVLPLGRYRALWQSYRERFQQLSDESEAFARIFGPEFTAAYREHERNRTDVPKNR